MSRPEPRRPRTSPGRRQRGLVLGRRFAGAFFVVVVVLALALGRGGAGFFFAAGFVAAGILIPFLIAFVVLALALGRAGAGFFFFAAGFVPVVAAAPDDTRDECLVRCRVLVGVAASAIEDRANAATSATTSVFSVLRIMRLR